MHKLFTTIILLGVLFGAVLFFWHKEIKEEAHTLTVSLREENGSFYTIDATYPHISNHLIDLDIDNVLNAQIAEFKKNVTEMGPHPVEGRMYGLYIIHEVLLLPQYVNITFYVSSDTGGAHPNNTLVTKIYDLKTGKAISLGDVFVPHSAYLGRISEITKKKLIQTIGEFADPQWIAEGTTPQEENFQWFTLTPQALVFHFPSYQVGPYALGEQNAEVTFEEIKDMLNPDIEKNISAEPVTRDIAYRNLPYHFETIYPSILPVESGRANEIVRFNFPVEWFEGTNLNSESRISVETKKSESCTPEEFVTSENVSAETTREINGKTWKYVEGGGAAAGNVYEDRVYTTQNNEMCVGVHLFLHSGNIGNYPEGSTREFNRDQILTAYDLVVSSFRFLEEVKN